MDTIIQSPSDFNRAPNWYNSSTMYIQLQKQDYTQKDNLYALYFLHHSKLKPVQIFRLH